MKKSTKQYASALYEVVRDMKAKDLSSVLKQFVRVLARDGALLRTDAIVERFRQQWNKNEAEVDITMTTAQHASLTVQKHVAQVIQKSVGAKRSTMRALVDPACIGGVIVRYDDVSLDASIRRQLMEMKQYLTK